MEVNKQQRRTANMAPSTRVYSPTRGSSAYAYVQEAAATPRPAQPERQPDQRQAAKPKRQARPQISLGTKVALVVGIALLACAGLFVVFRYHNIARQYAQVNALQANISNTQLHIRELNVALECAVNIEDAQEAALRFGMTYPTASQYVRVGDELPVAAGQYAQDEALHNDEETMQQQGDDGPAAGGE